MCGILNQGYPLIGQIEENDRSAEHTDRAKYLNVQKMADTNQGKNQDLAEDALEADSRGELMIGHRAHDPSNVIQNNKGQERVQQAITAAEEIAEPAAHGREHELNGSPKLFRK